MSPRAGGAVPCPPLIYYLDPVAAGPVGNWGPHLARARDMGFSHVGVAPVFAPRPGGSLFLADDFERAAAFLGAGDSADAAACKIAALANDFGLQVVLDIVINQVARDGAMTRSAPGWFHQDEKPVLDPRHLPAPIDAASARFDDPACAAQIRTWWVDRLVRLARVGAASFRLIGLENAPADFLRQLLREVRLQEEDCSFFGWTPGVSWPRLADLERVKLDGVFASTAWWDGRASWFVEEHNALRRIAPVLSVVEAPFGERLASQTHGRDLHAAYRRALSIALCTGHGLFVPMGFEDGARDRMRDRIENDAHTNTEPAIDLREDIRSANALAARLSSFGSRGEIRRLSDVEEVVSVHLIADASDVRTAERGLVLLVNTDSHQVRPVTAHLDPLAAAAGGAFGAPQTIDGAELSAPLDPDATRLLSVTRTQPVRERSLRNARAATNIGIGARIAIEHVTPCIDDGAFAVKRIVGRSISVEDDRIPNGHQSVPVARTVDKRHPEGQLNGRMSGKRFQ